MIGRALLVLSLALGCGGPDAATSTDSSASPSARASSSSDEGRVKGKWSGQVTETGVKDAYPVTVSLRCLTPGKICGTTEYPQHKCGGKLLYYGLTEDEADYDEEDEDDDRFDLKVARVHAFTEILTFGEEHCSNRGRLLLTVTDKALGFSWIDARNADHRATATLVRK